MSSLKKAEETLPATIDFSADLGAGFEEADSSAYAIPFLKQLQAMSPQCKKTDPAYVKGAEEGDFYNTVTEKLYKGDVGIIVIPVYYAHKYNEWLPNRGGFRGSHSAAEYVHLQRETIMENGKPVEINKLTGNYLQDTREHYLLIVNEDGTTEPALLTLTSSQIKKSKKWMTLMQGIRIKGQVAPMFSQKYRITAVGESNDQGSWAGVKIEHVGPVTDPTQYEEAKAFRDMIRSGTAQAAPLEEDIPF